MENKQKQDELCVSNLRKQGNNNEEKKKGITYLKV